MKIPETTVNVGAYYGNEENGQWQPNGVIIDNGVGGGVVGSGDAGIHRGPVYPVHIPRGQMPGYVVAGAFYPPAGYPPVAQQPPDDFADYMWMEHEEEFDKQVMQQLEEEALMEQCIEAMLEDEQRERHNRPMANGHKRNHNHNHYPTTSNGGPSVSLEEAVSRSTLNPLAAEFYPTRVRPVSVPPAPQPHTDERQESTAAPTEEVQQTREEQPRPASTEVTVEPKTEVTVEPKADEALPPQKDPPEVSAADVQPILDKVQEKRPPRDMKKDMAQTKPRIDNKAKTTKTEVKRTKPQAAKSEPVVHVKKEVKTVKSETKVEVRDSEKVKEADKVKSEAETVRCEVKVEKELPPVVVAEIPKVQPSQPEDQQASTGFKPINYAAAAKANKPKKPSPPPAAEKPAPPPPPPASKTKPAEKKDKRPEKVPSKDKQPVMQRKNSVK